ncbi:hypothetical protein BH09MYX1_BH09MYX1_00980 [soil metagenome]
MSAVEEVMAKKTKPATQITVRLEDEWLGRLDALATALSRPGLELTRVDAIRMAVARGLLEIETETTVALEPRKERVYRAVLTLRAKVRNRMVTSEAIEEKLEGEIEVSDVQGDLAALCEEERLRRRTEGGRIGYLVIDR